MKNINNLNYIYWWLVICCSLVFIMVFIGGLTRLTESGLSIVEWNIFKGILPPLKDTDWIDLFEKYKKYPEFLLVNKNINLDQFKFIFWMEYIHRIWGRLIFLVFFIPLITFLIKKLIPKKFIKHFFIILSLIILQGFFGWYMVKSGLINKPDVSHYRLSLHLVTAFIIYGYLLFITFCIYDLKKNRKKIFTKNKNLRFVNLILICLIVVTVFSGGMVAGLDAGLTYNTFPFMGEKLIPIDIWYLEPKFLNFFENPVTVQFDHRVLGVTTLFLTIIFWICIMLNDLSLDLKKKATILLIVVFIQIIFGIATLLSYVSIPIAIMHQSGALILFSISIWTLKSLPFVSK